MGWMIICIFVVGISCFFLGFCIRRRRNNNNRQNVRENTDDHEVILVNTYSNKDLSISHSSYQINSKVLKKKSNSFVESSKQNLAISQTNLIINNNIGIGRDLPNKYGSLKIVKNINFDVIDNEVMSFFRRPGIFSKRLEELKKIEKQQISRRYRKVKSKIKDMSAPNPMDEDVKEDDEI